MGFWGEVKEGWDRRRAEKAVAAEEERRNTHGLGFDGSYNLGGDLIPEFRQYSSEERADSLVRQNAVRMMRLGEEKEFSFPGEKGAWRVTLQENGLFVAFYIEQNLGVRYYHDCDECDCETKIRDPADLSRAYNEDDDDDWDDDKVVCPGCEHADLRDNWTDTEVTREKVLYKRLFAVRHSPTWDFDQ